MLIEYDPAKNASNILRRGLPFDLMALFDWATATIEQDKRRDYGEERFQATGWIGQRLHVVIFTMRGNVARIISLRKANKRERQRHEKPT